MADSYAGYVKRATPINWGAVAGDIVNKMGDVEKEQEAFREKYDTMASDLYKELGDYEAGKSQEMNQFVYNGIAAGRDNLGALHQKLKRREISPDDFNRATMSMGSEMDKLKQLTTNYDEAVVGAIEGIDNGTLDNVLSGWALTKFGELSNLKDKNLQWMPGQDGYTTLYVNEEGKEPVSMSVATNPNNLIFKRVDIVEAFKPLTQEIGAYQTATANGTLDDASAKEGFDSLKTASINKILSDDNAIASVLAQYGGYEPYTEGDPVPAKGILMKIGEDGKHFVPQVEDLRSIAEDIVGSHLSQMLDYKETKYRTTTIPADKPPYTEKQLNEYNAGYVATWNATNAYLDDDGNVKGFEFMDNSKYQFKLEGDKITVTDSDGAVLLSQLERGTAETAQALAPYYSDTSFGGTEWKVIHDKENQQVKEVSYIMPIKSYDEIFKITNLNTDNEKGLSTAKENITTIITNKAPEAKITFGPISSASGLNYMDIIVGGKVVGSFITDLAFAADKDDEEFKSNKKVIEDAINAAKSGKGNPAP